MKNEFRDLEQFHVTCEPLCSFYLKKEDLTHQNTVDNSLTVCVCVFIVLWTETVTSVTTHTHAKVLR